jgi:hypothetical protein
MSGADKRLDRLLPGLSAKERALLMLRDFKDGKPQDRQLLHTAPEPQTTELNRLIGLMNASNGDVAHLIAIIRERAEKEVLRLGWLEWARICALEMWAVGSHFNLSAMEPITESDYRANEAEARSEMIAIDECAMQVAEYHHLFDEADYETDGEGDRVVTDEAWYRVRDQKLAELRALAEAGTLASSGKGKRMKIACGSFYDWLGEPVPVAPDFGLEFEVMPDHRKADVDRKLRDHAFIRKLLDRGACKFDLPLDIESPLVMAVPPGGFDVELARVLAVALRAGVRENWRELRAIELQIDEVIAAFDGEDVLHPLVRDLFNEAKATLIELHDKVQEYTGPFELPEPDDELRATIEKIIAREASHVPTR